MPDPALTETAAPDAVLSHADIWRRSANRWHARWVEERRLHHHWETEAANWRLRHERDTDRLQRDNAELRDLVREALNHTDLPVCGECKGTGKVRDEEMVGGRTWMGVREVVVECGECRGLGRVL